ncbi:Trehalose synthase/amylase TreS [Caulifigura coniformis]|uniref:maltose alpha-D-glucosyltransferase n=1 Tax=Caulifigura coniformis TaxID=2527983 RepID=A0A517SCJ4_9PLAN|nr:maltose alpha-D-glucosyltransferase [Caulifigura coniformis]QDT53850.1 Trehalose synthase/amylase TreS [Caulifigura coniformis]
MNDTDDQWYKDAIFYQVYVRGFQDSTGDGIGDLRGLIQRLDYLADLGVTCLWLMPIYESPLKDDGYDIADFLKIDPRIGTVDDFQALCEAAHARGLRIIADMVLNHTSDRHAWFQEARSNPESPKRDYYVWSDTDQKYQGVRIIFTDTEPSNWTWDPVARQYYWHRFFSHQPDLNYDNPAVQQEMLDIIGFWLDKGIDGFRVDAVPYLFEREGTNCENLFETHGFLKKMRAYCDEKKPGTLLLAEANQWPADLLPYFGDGDEFQMAFNFPLMPRMFMAIRREQRRPIVDIMEQLPSIPSNCQWAIFLRNHDELTLEMVTDEDRDYMYREYAQDPRMRLNLGIRRRLAPLMENGRRQIELLHSMLFSLPGSPVLYYGDEITMGDNIYLGDRNGVRTPMQWTGDRNSGFSTADPSRLYQPVITDPIYHFQAVNVESSQRSPTSLLNWLKRMVRLRTQHPVFARGSLEFIDGGNERVIAYLRTLGDETMLVVNNLSRFAQPVKLDLSRFIGFTPVELMGNTPFPPVDHTPYFLSIGPHSFLWFKLVTAPVGEAVVA